MKQYTITISNSEGKEICSDEIWIDSDYSIWSAYELLEACCDNYVGFAESHKFEAAEDPEDKTCEYCSQLQEHSIHDEKRRI